jgi:ribonuclease Y
MEEKIEKLEEKKDEYQDKKIELEKILEKEKTILSDLSGLTPEEAKQQLFGQIEEDNKAEIKRFINKYKMIKEEEAKEEAGKIIAKILPRVAQDGMNEHLVTMVDLPSEDMKGKIIGRE